MGLTLGFLLPALNLDPRGLGRPGSLSLQLCVTLGCQGSNAKEINLTGGAAQRDSPSAFSFQAKASTQEASATLTASTRAHFVSRCVPHSASSCLAMALAEAASYSARDLKVSRSPAARVSSSSSSLIRAAKGRPTPEP